MNTLSINNNISNRHPPKGLCDKRFCKFKCIESFSVAKQISINYQYYNKNRKVRNDFIIQNTERILSDDWDNNNKIDSFK